MAKKAVATKQVEKKEKVSHKKEKKTKSKKDKNAPKRAISAFFFYQKERRESLKREQPALDNKQIISKMSVEWNNMNEAARVPYAKMAEGDKSRYEKAKKEYEKTKGTATASVTKSATKPKKSAKKEESDEAENDAEDQE